LTVRVTVRYFASTLIEHIVLACRTLRKYRDVNTRWLLSEQKWKSFLIRSAFLEIVLSNMLLLKDVSSSVISFFIFLTISYVFGNHSSRDTRFRVTYIYIHVSCNKRVLEVTKSFRFLLDVAGRWEGRVSKRKRVVQMSKVVWFESVFDSVSFIYIFIDLPESNMICFTPNRKILYIGRQKTNKTETEKNFDTFCQRQTGRAARTTVAQTRFWNVYVSSAGVIYSFDIGSVWFSNSSLQRSIRKN